MAIPHFRSPRCFSIVLTTEKSPCIQERDLAAFVENVKKLRQLGDGGRARKGALGALVNSIFFFTIITKYSWCYWGWWTFTNIIYGWFNNYGFFFGFAFTKKHFPCFVSSWISTYLKIVSGGTDLRGNRWDMWYPKWVSTGNSWKTRRMSKLEVPRVPRNRNFLPTWLA